MFSCVDGHRDFVPVGGIISGLRLFQNYPCQSFFFLFDSVVVKFSRVYCLLTSKTKDLTFKDFLLRVSSNTSCWLLISATKE